MSETREYITGPGFTSRIAREQLRSTVVALSFLGPVGVVFLGLTALAAVSGPGQWAAQAPFIVGYVLFLAVLVGVLFLVTKSQADRATPVGSRYAVALGEGSMVVSVGAAASEVPYGSYSRVVRRGGFVVLRFRSMRLSLVLPAELFPGGDVDRLVAAVADPNAATAVRTAPGPPDAGLDREYVTDPGYTGRLARWATVRLFTRGPVVVVVGLLAAVGVLLVLVSLLGLLLVATGNSPLGEVVPLVAGAAGVIGFVALLVGGSLLLVRTQLRRLIPVGSVYGVGFGDTALRVRGPVNSSDLPYASYRRARRRGRFVELAGRRGVSRVTLPAELFPGSELDRLNALLRQP